MNALAITSDIANYTYRNWALQEAQRAFNEVDRLFLSWFEI